MPIITPEERKSIYRNISRTVLAKIRRDKSIYLEFGKLKTGEDEKLKKQLFRYGLFITRCKVKSEFDQYKKWYRFSVKKQAVKQAYEHTVDLQRIWDRNPQFLSFSSIGYIHQKWNEMKFPMTLNQFMVMIGVFTTHYQTKIYWQIDVITPTTVQMFSGPFSTTFKKSFNTLIEKGIIAEAYDNDIQVAWLKRMGNQSKNPVVKRILKEKQYRLSQNGKSLLRDILMYQLEYLDKVEHNSKFFERKNIPPDLKDAFKSARRLLKRPNK